MKLTDQQLAYAKHLASAYIEPTGIISDPIEMFRLKRTQRIEFEQATGPRFVLALLADLEEAERKIALCIKSRDEEIAELESELSATRQQLAEAQARNSVLSNAISFAKRALDLQAAPPPSTVMRAEYQIEVMKEAGRVVRAALCTEPSAALSAKEAP